MAVKSTTNELYIRSLSSGHAHANINEIETREKNKIELNRIESNCNKRTNQREVGLFDLVARASSGAERARHERQTNGTSQRDEMTNSVPQAKRAFHSDFHSDSY